MVLRRNRSLINHAPPSLGLALPGLARSFPARNGRHHPARPETGLEAMLHQIRGRDGLGRGCLLQTSNKSMSPPASWRHCCSVASPGVDTTPGRPARKRREMPDLNTQKTVPEPNPGQSENPALCIPTVFHEPCACPDPASCSWLGNGTRGPIGHGTLVRPPKLPQLTRCHAV